MSNFAKKAFSGFISLTTIAWSVTVGTFALPNVASAAMTGDLIKASGPAVYYYASDMKRYVFPNERTYFSWYRDFSSVKTISDTELASIMIGGNVTMRPGTNLVKITTDPKVYAVTKGGVLHWIESEAVAVALFGSNWAQRVVDVPDAFFVNYTVGSSVSTPVHPDGSLVMYSGDSNRYVIEGGMKRRITSDAAFMANGFNAANVMMTTVSYPNGSDVTGRESNLADTVMPGSVTPVGGSLTVSLASDTPAGVTTPKNASSVMLAKYNFTAGSADALLTGLRIRRIGVGSASDLANVYLYDSMGNRLTTGRTINNTTNLVEFNSLNWTVPAGQTKALVLVGDFSNPSSTGGQHSFELSDAASAVIAGNGTVSGSFPVRGNVFTVGTTAAGRLDVQKGTTPSNPNIGTTDAEIANFKLTANTNDIEVRRVTLLQSGSVSNSDLSDLKLYQGSTVVATASALMGDKIVLNFNPAYLITNGTTRTFSLRAKIGGRANRTIRTYVEYTTDVYAIDRTYNSGASVCITSSGSCTTGSYDGSSTNYSEVTTQGGQLTVAFNGPGTANVAKGNQDVKLFNFSLTSQDNALEVRKLNFRVERSGGSGQLYNGTTDFLRDIKVIDVTTGATVMGPTSLNLSGNTTGQAFTLTESFNLAAGQTRNLAITADLANSDDALFIDKLFLACLSTNTTGGAGNCTGNIFNTNDVRVVDTGEFLDTSKIVPNTAITGNAMTVKASSLSVSLASSPVSATAVKRQQNIDTAGYVFTAGAQSDVIVRTVKLTGRGNESGSYTAAGLAGVVTSCALFDGSTQVGVSRSPDTTAGTMDITNMNLTIPKGTSKTLVVRCTADSSVNGTEDMYAVGIAAAGDVTADDSDSNSVTASVSAAVVANSGASPSLSQTVKDKGTLSIQTNNMRQSTIVVADNGMTWQNFAEFKATAQFEPVKLERMIVTSTGQAANFTAVAIAVNGQVVGQDTLPAGFSTFREVDLTNSPITVPKDGSVTFQIWGKLANVQSSSSVNGATTGAARSGAQLKLGLAAGETTNEFDSNYSSNFNVKSVGAASGDRIYTAGSDTVGNTMVVRKSKPVVTRQNVTTATLSNGTNQELYKFQVSADAAGAIALKRVTFDFSKSGTTTLANFRIRKGATEIALADVVITDGAGADLEAGTVAAATSSGRVVVTFTNEETISGSGSVYTLLATPAASVAGDTVTFSMTRDTSNTVTTAYLNEGNVSVNGTALYGGTSGVPGNLDTGTSGVPDGTADVAGTFVWSDNSEVPHSFAKGTLGGSYDWTNDVYAEDLTQAQTLSR